MGNIVDFRQSQGGSAGNITKNDARWSVSIEYRSEQGGMLSTHYIEEIADLHAIIENGPHVDTIVKCVVTVNRQSGDIPRLTKEQAEIL